MKKSFISAVAAITVLSSGAYAFDTDSSGKLLVLKDITEANGTIKPQVNNKDIFPKLVDGKANYIVGSYKHDQAKSFGQAADALKLSQNQFGDALIYPAFNFSDKDGTSTEISVTNVKDKAVIAKVVLYAKSDSRELLDFNVYLSANDIFKFTINPDGSVSTKDGSIMKEAANPMSNKDFDDTKANVHGEEFTFQNSIQNNDGSTVARDVKLAEEAGYAIIYGMAQADKDYHGKHKELFADYRKLLDDVRANWRNGWRYGGLTNGIFTLDNIKAVEDGVTLDEVKKPIVAPNVKGNITVSNSALSNKVKPNESVVFNGVDSDALMGSVRIFGGTGNAARNLTINATALENFTMKDQMVLWTEAEYASLHDRRIVADGQGVKYDVDALLNDSKAFLKDEVYYSFTNYFNADGTPNPLAQNKLIFTQPYKRVLVQLKQTQYGEYWHEAANADAKPYGAFTLLTKIWDDNENSLVDPTAPESIYKPGFWTSPGTTKPGTVAPQASLTQYTDEVQSIANYQFDFLRYQAENGKSTLETIQKLQKASAGYMLIKFHKHGTKEDTMQVPAIVTQMNSVIVDGKPSINWFYAPTITKPAANPAP